MFIRSVFFTITCILVTGCSGTTVVLVPDPGGKVGQVSVSTPAGTTLLTKANESTQATKAEQAPSQPIVLSDKDIQDKFAATLSKEPTPPARFNLFYATGSIDVSAEGNAVIGNIVSAIKSRLSCDLSVIGHSDRVGDDVSNRGISLQRAENVAKALIHTGVPSHCLDVRYYGENDPAIPTDDNVPEARNRRVEVEIR